MAFQNTKSSQVLQEEIDCIILTEKKIFQSKRWSGNIYKSGYNYSTEIIKIHESTTKTVSSYYSW